MKMLCNPNKPAPTLATTPANYFNSIINVELNYAGM
jgi:hypothetical protein